MKKEGKQKVLDKKLDSIVQIYKLQETEEIEFLRVTCCKPEKKHFHVSLRKLSASTRIYHLHSTSCLVVWYHEQPPN